MTMVRRGLVWLVLAVAVTGMAACQGSTESPEEEAAAGTDDDAAAQENDAQPQSGGELVVGFTDDQYVLEGEDANFGMYPLNADIVETLTYLNTDYEVEPFLATDWEFVPPKTWRFHLREDVTFHDGQPMTAQDVKEGLFDRYAQQEDGGVLKAGPDSTEVIDEHTIEFTPTETNMRVPQQLVHPSRGVVSPDHQLGERPVGTGPFQFVEYEPDEHLVVERYEDYWDGPAPLERITYRFYPEAASRRLALEAGDIHAMYDVPRSDVERLEGGFEIATSGVGAYRALTVETTEGVLQDRRLRQAIAYGIDRDALVDDVLHGLATSDQTFVPPAVLGDHADTIEGFSYEPETAHELIQDAGWEQNDNGMYQQDGEPLALTLATGFPSAEAHRPVPQFLQSHLGDLGIEVSISESPDSATFYDRMAERQGDLWLEEGNQNDGNPAFLPALLYYTGPGSGGGGTLAEIAAPGEAFNDAILPTFEEPDIEPVREATAEALHILIDEETTVIPLAGVFRIYGLDEQVRGFEPHQAFTHARWGDAWLAD